MLAATWYADVNFTVTDLLTPDTAIDITEHLASHGAAMSLSRDGKTAGMSLAIDAKTALEAANKAARIVDDALEADFKITKLDVRDASTMAQEITTPVIPDLVSYAEIAEIAGVSRQRARQFAAIEGFPKPVVETAAGPLRLKASVEAWVERRNTKPGRPRKTT